MCFMRYHAPPDRVPEPLGNYGTLSSPERSPRSPRLLPDLFWNQNWDLFFGGRFFFL